MKPAGKLLAVLALLASFGALAADPLPRKEAILETGAGGLRLTVSLPDYAEGPQDLAGKKGPLVHSHPEHGEVVGGVLFTLAIGNSALLSYQATVARHFTPHVGAESFSAENLAGELIRQAGFDGHAVPLGCPPSALVGASIVCYRMTGDKAADGKIAAEKAAHVLIAVSFDQDKQGYTLMATIAERDVARFAADQVRYEKIATNALGDLWKNHKIEVR